MVYESSTRRIYSSASPRPVISTSYSYSPVSSVEDGVMCNNSNYYLVALPPMLPGPASPAGPIPVVTKLHRSPHLVLAYTPGISKGHIFNPIAIPRVAHRRLVSVSPPPRRGQNGQNYYDMLESGIHGNYGNRIVLVRYRPTPPPVPQKVLWIEDVTDPSGSRLLRRELSRSPSPYDYGCPWEITGPSNIIPIPRPIFSLHNIPLRSASEVKEVADLRRLYVRDRNPDVGYSPLNKALLYRMPTPCYVDPSIQNSYYSGRGNLSCLSFAGGRPISKRRRFYPDYDDKIGDEIIFRSFYTKLRDAASAGRNAGKRLGYQPIYYSKKTLLGEENCPKREPKESKWVERALANEKPYVPRVKPSSTKQPVATETVIASPRKESLKLESKPATPPPVQPVNVTLPGPRKSITEIIREDIPRIENLPEENVTVKMPKKHSIPREATPPPAREPTPPPPREPTPPPPKEATPPPKEATPPPKDATPPPKEPTPPPVEQPKEEAPAAEEAPAPVDEPAHEAAPPPKEPTPPPVEQPKEEAPPAEEAPAAVEEPAQEVPTEVAAPAAEEAPAKPAEAAAPSSEPPSEEVSPSDQASGDASNKGEVEDIQLDEEITLDEVCDVEENDLEIESDDPETSQSVASADQMPQVESSSETEGPATASDEPAATEPAAPTEDTVKAPEIDQDAVSPTPVSIVVADIDGPIPPPEEDAVQEEPQTVEEIQLEAERRRAEFAQLLEEHAELVTTVTKLERVAVIVSKSCAEALAQQEHEEQQPPSSTDSQKSK